MMLTFQQAADWQDILVMNALVNRMPDNDEDDLADDDDENYDDLAEDDNDLREIRVNDDLGEPDPEDDDHLPEEELQ
jgi:hypothetical protein